MIESIVKYWSVVLLRLTVGLYRFTKFLAGVYELLNVHISLNV